jgi:hypothetical protein
MIVIGSPTDYLDVLGEVIDLEVLPSCVAPGYGKGKGMKGGYFEDLIWEGGPIPSRMEAEKKLRLRVHDGRKSLIRQASTDSTTTTDLSFSKHTTLTPTGMISARTTCLLQGFWNDEPSSMDDSYNTARTTISVFPACHTRCSNLASF